MLRADYGFIARLKDPPTGLQAYLVKGSAVFKNMTECFQLMTPVLFREGKHCSVSQKIFILLIPHRGHDKACAAHALEHFLQGRPEELRKKMNSA